MRRREIGAVPRLALSGRHFDASSLAANPTVPCFFFFLTKKMLLLEPPKMLLVYNRAHTGTQQGGVPEEGENRRTSSRFYFSHAFQAPSMTAYPLDAVSAAGLLCTHGKDKPGSGGP